MKEIWKPVVGYEELYSVSNLGRVKRIKSLININGHIHQKTRVVRERILTPILKNRGKGYLCVFLSRNSKIKNVQIHGLVMSSFIGKRANGYEVNHKDGNSKNNNLNNLEYLTNLENIRHAIKIGLFNHKGSKNGGSILKEIDVINIRNKFTNGCSIDKLSNEYNLKRNSIYLIVTRRNWRHI